MKDLYENLFDILAQCYQENKEEKLSIFVPMKGSLYNSEKIKMMVVGRAVNGWGETAVEQRNNFTNHIIEDIECEKRFDWIEKEKAEHNYDALAKPFWHYTKSILETLRGKRFESPNWYEAIAWANLFPISYACTNKGNPSNRIKYAQFQTAKNLLIAQIEHFKPTHVLVISGWAGWFVLQKSKKYHMKEDTKFLPNVYERNVNNEVVRGSGSYVITGSSASEIIHIPVVVSRRPEFFNKETFVNEVAIAFQHPEGAK